MLSSLQGKIFVPFVNPEATTEDILKAFEPFEVNDVNRPGNGKNFMFVFLTCENKEAVLQANPKGLRYRFAGTKWGKMNLTDGDDRKKGKKAPVYSTVAAPAPVSALVPAASATPVLPARSSDVDSLVAKTDAPKVKKQPKKALPSFDVVIKNLHYYAKPQDVRNLFMGFTPTKVVLPRNSKGIAYVGFATNGEAGRAVGQLNGKKVLGRPVRVESVKPR